MNITIVDLIGLEIATIKALTSVAALKLYQADQIKVTDFVNMTATEINNTIMSKFKQDDVSEEASFDQQFSF